MLQDLVYHQEHGRRSDAQRIQQRNRKVSLLKACACIRESRTVLDQEITFHTNSLETLSLRNCQQAVHAADKKKEEGYRGVGKIFTLLCL